LISCQDFNAAAGDIEGRAAVKRNWKTTGGFGVGLKTDTTSNGYDMRQDFALVVGHNCTYDSGSIWPDGSGHPNNSTKEDIFVGEVWSGPSYMDRRVTDQSTVIGDKDQYFDTGCQYYKTLSDHFAAQPTNTQWKTYYASGIHIICNNASDTLYYVQIPDTAISASNWWSISSCNIAASFVITVTGTGNVVFKGGLFPSVTEKVIFNVPGTGRTVHVETGLQGSLLAPGSTFEQANGVTYGLVIVYTVNSFVQANKPNCHSWKPVQLLSKIAGPTSTTTNPANRKRGTPSTQVSLIPLFDFGSWSLSDQITIGNETCTIVGGTMSAGKPALICVPPIVGQYLEGTDIVGSVQLVRVTWPRASLNENIAYIDIDPSVAIPTTASAQTTQQTQTPPTTSPIAGTTVPVTVITDVTGTPTTATVTTTGDDTASAITSRHVRVTGQLASVNAANSVAVCFTMMVVACFSLLILFQQQV